MPNEGQWLKLLRRRDLSGEEVEALLQDRAARRYHAVRLALAAHPRTPRREALSLVETLFWRDLAALSADSRVHPEVRRAADRDLLRRLPEMALSERVDLAKCVGRGTLIALRLDSETRVLEALLENRFLTEADVIQASIHGGATESSLALIAAHPRWSLRQGVRSALLRNPTLPVPVALGLLPRASRADLDGILESPQAAEILKACAERILARRVFGV
jgi:hypothetical protein